MEECGFDVEVLNVPTEARSDVEKGAERFQTGSGGGGFGEIDSRLLGEPFRHIAHFVSGDLTSIVPFPFADKLSFEEPSAMWDRRARHECEYLEVLEAT